MRETYTTLQTVAQQYCNNDTDATTLTFLQNELNRAKRFVFAELGEYVNQRYQSATSATNQQYYHYPMDAVNIEALQVTIGGVNYPCEVIDSQLRWDQLNAIQFQGTAIPEYLFPRKRDVGVWPIPQDTTWTIQMTYQAKEIDMSIADYTTGTVNLTNGSQTIVGVGTSFSAAMIGRWFNSTITQTGDGFWYKVINFTDTTHITVEEAYQGTTVTGASYTIGESSDLPEETHPLFAYRAAAMYFAGLRGDIEKSRFWMNMFWTEDPMLDIKTALQNPDLCKGGLFGLKVRYANKSEDRIIHRKNPPTKRPNDLLWAIKVKAPGLAGG